MVYVMKIMAPLLKDTENETLVNLPSGKLSKADKRVAINPQKNITCLLYSLRRIAFFNNPDVKHTNLYEAFRYLKRELKNFQGDYEALLNSIREICIQLNIDAVQVITRSKSYSESAKNRNHVQFSLLYEAVVNQRLFSLFNLQESGWTPSDGFSGLKESLRQHGAHVFIGKFGAWCHMGSNKLVPLKNENTENREVYAFKKGSYAGDRVPWTHAIVIDQVKVVNDREMVFFRDPYQCSGDSNKEKIYALSYENFIQRLTNQQSQPYRSNVARHENSYGIVSANANNLLR